jgi:hypothetical protein
LTKTFNSEHDFYSLPVVWHDVESVYRPLLAEHPQAINARTDFLKYAVTGAHWDVAREQVTALGDDHWKPSFANESDYRTFRDVARNGGAPGAAHMNRGR